MKTKRALIMLALAVMLTGMTTYDLSLLKLRYEQMGSQCVSIE